MSALGRPFVRSLGERARIVRTARADGGSIAWRIWGGGSHGRDAAAVNAKPLDTIVLVHGSYGSWMHWARNIDALASRMRVVAVDVPGFGDSGEPVAGATAPSVAEKLAGGWMQLVDAERPAWGAGGRLFIAGFSLGGVYAGWMARRMCAQPGATRPAGLVLLAPGGLGAREVVRLPLRRIPEELKHPSKGEERREVHRHNLGVAMFAEAACIDDAAVFIQDANVAGARARGPFIHRPDLLLEALRGIQLPVLGLWGSRDAFDADVGVRVAALLEVAPTARTMVIPDAGHWVGYESAERVNQAVLDWIGEHVSI